MKKPFLAWIPARRPAKDDTGLERARRTGQYSAYVDRQPPSTMASNRLFLGGGVFITIPPSLYPWRHRFDQLLERGVDQLSGGAFDPVRTFGPNLSLWRPNQIHIDRSWRMAHGSTEPHPTQEASEGHCPQQPGPWAGGGDLPDSSCTPICPATAASLASALGARWVGGAVGIGKFAEPRLGACMLIVGPTQGPPQCPWRRRGVLSDRRDD